MDVCKICPKDGPEFSAAFTFDSGQAFRWRPADDKRESWIGIVNGNVLKIANLTASLLGRLDQQDGGDLSELISRYFSSDDDLNEIFRSFPKDDCFLQSAVSEFAGLRLLTQDPWECLISFVCSIDCNIPSIRLKIENLSRKFGTKIHTLLDQPFYSFPTPEKISKAEKWELLGCKLGFRWRYVQFIAREVSNGNLDLDKIQRMPYEGGFHELVSETSGKTFGVGPKVADCALLYSYHKKEAFPLDVWLLKYVQMIYGQDYLPRTGLSRKRYVEISSSLRKKFGPNAGYAQLFLYEKVRRGGIIRSKELA